MTHPKAFVSYSWDSDEHKFWVRNLSERLRLNGVDVKLDQWDVLPGQSLTQFMEVQVQECDFTLVVCTPNYSRRSIAREGGVGYEQQIITGNIAAGVKRERFIPIVREGDFKPGDKCSIPPQFQGVYAIDMRDEAKITPQFEQLLRAIHRVPALVPPPLGVNPFSKDGPKSSLTCSNRLATIALDGYTLVSGVAHNERHPDTFWMPEDKLRHGLTPGQFVKLMFDISTTNGIEVERMWVEIENQDGPYYIGRLDNDCVTTNDSDVLNLNAKVVFLPEHVIDIYNKN